MAAELRQSGIEIVGDVPWGTHLCHFYESQGDLLDLLIPYFAAGLASNEFVIWIVFPPREVDEAKAALRRALPDADQHLAAGDIEILPHSQWYVREGRFDPQSVLDAWREKLATALARGYDGMRANGNEAWLTAGDWDSFKEYEEELDRQIAGERIIVLCAYPLATATAADILDVAHSHQFAIANRGGRWEVVETPTLKRTKAEMALLNEDLERRVTERTKELAAANERLDRTMVAAVSLAADVVEMRDPYTAGHQRRVADLAREIAGEMQLSADSIDGIHMAGLIHDIGKIGIPAEILSKPGRLSASEFALIKEHPRTGSDILKGVEFPWPISQIILHHHERIDGSGYPMGLIGTEIGIETRVLIVADVVEAIASNRPYRPAFGISSALEEIENNKDVLYDADAVDVCLRLFREDGYAFEPHSPLGLAE